MCRPPKASAPPSPATAFGSRARRAEYWWYYLFQTLVYIAAAVLDGVTNASRFLIMLVFAALLLPYLSVSVRRLHDTGRSGWWLLLTLVPVAGFVFWLVFAVQDSQPGMNHFGPSPKEPPAYTPFGYDWQPTRP